MKKAIMNVSRFSNEDVIATSGFQYATAFTLSNFGNGTASDGSISFNNGVSKSFADIANVDDFQSLFSDNINVGTTTVNGIKYKSGGTEQSLQLFILYPAEAGALSATGIDDTYTWNSTSGYFEANALK